MDHSSRFKRIRHSTDRRFTPAWFIEQVDVSISLGAIQARLNIVFSGGTGTGKTTLLEVLSEYISDQERLVIIEDVPELKVRQPNVARLCSRPPNLEGKGNHASLSLLTH